MKKKCIAISMLLLKLCVFSNTTTKDSLFSLPEIIISKNRIQQYTNSFYEIDSIQQQFSNSNNIGNVLQKYTTANLLTYGGNGITTIALRGTADDHTNTYWNNVKLNSITLGTTDFSLLLNNANSNVSLITNTSSSIFGSGSFGGAITINTIPNFTNKIAINLRSDIASYNNYNNQINLQIGNKKVQFHSSFITQNGKNNFKYFDVFKANSSTEKLQHNTINQYAFINSIFIKMKQKQSIDFGSWIQFKNKEIPNIMGIYQQSNKYQTDKNIRHYIKYKKVFNKAILNIQSSYLFDFMNYKDKWLPTDSLYYINSNFRTHQTQNTLNYKQYINTNLSVDFGAEYHFQKANVANYGIVNAKQNMASFYAGMIYNFKKIETNFTMRQDYYTQKYIRPLVGINIKYKPIKNYNITFSYNDKYRFPDFNDRFWQPGGNPNIEPEKGWSVELNNEYILSKHNHLLKINNAIYFIKINNNIVWLPTTNGSIWSPKNYKTTQHFGIDLDLNYTYNLNKKIAINTNLIYTYNHSTITNDIANLNGKILRYRPNSVIKINQFYNYKFATIGYNLQYTSSQFTDEENIKAFALKPYFLMDIFIAAKHDFKKINTQFVFNINNISNTRYQTVRSYAQPLRNYSLTILFNYHKQQQNE